VALRRIGQELWVVPRSLTLADVAESADEAVDEMSEIASYCRKRREAIGSAVEFRKGGSSSALGHGQTLHGPCGRGEAGCHSSRYRVGLVRWLSASGPRACGALCPAEAKALGLDLHRRVDAWVRPTRGEWGRGGGRVTTSATKNLEFNSSVGPAMGRLFTPAGVKGVIAVMAWRQTARGTEPEARPRLAGSTPSHASIDPNYRGREIRVLIGPLPEGPAAGQINTPPNPQAR